GQANHIGVTIEADLIKQKQPENHGGFTALNFGKTHKRLYQQPVTDHPIDLTRRQAASCYRRRVRLITRGGTSARPAHPAAPIDLTRWQVASCYMGRVGLINSGGSSAGQADLAAAVRTAVINKRAGGTGLISGRKAFQRPTEEGIELLNAIQDVYLDGNVTMA